MFFIVFMIYKKYLTWKYIRLYQLFFFWLNSIFAFGQHIWNHSKILKQAQDPRLQAEGKAGQSTEMGVIFLSSQNISSEAGSEWVIGTCVKSPCVAAGNNELTSVYR